MDCVEEDLEKSTDISNNDGLKIDPNDEKAVSK